MLFDTHAHVDHRQFDSDRSEVLERARQAGVDRLLNIGFSEAVIPGTLALAEAHTWVYAAVGIHPHHAKEVTPETWEKLDQWRQHPKVRAIGEIGLDYHYDFSPREVQQAVFREQIRLARRWGLPVVIHNRESDADMLRILQEEDAGAVGGVFHCFAGDWAMAEAGLAMNFSISFAGPVTFNRNQELREIAARVPADRILVETDCPYLAPVPHRGKRNEPALVRHTAQTVADVRGVSLEELAALTTANARRVLRID